MTLNKLLLAACLALTTLSAGAATRSKAQMKETATQAINAQRSQRHLAPQRGELKALKTTDTYTIYAYDQQEGFAIVTADDVAPAVIGVSDRPYSGGDNEGLAWYLAMAEKVISHAAKNNIKLNTTK